MIAIVWNGKKGQLGNYTNRIFVVTVAVQAQIAPPHFGRFFMPVAFLGAWHHTGV